MGGGSRRALLGARRLAHAHARGVIHRDLKPSSVLVASVDRPGEERYSRVLLSDFGLAHAFEEVVDPGTVRGGSAGGTPAYMAPEQIRHDWRSFGPPTDLYALGCVTYELVCGRPPFDVQHVPAALVAHLEAPPPPVTRRFPAPPRIEAWIHRLLQKHPGDRYACAAEAARALRALDGSTGNAPAWIETTDPGAPASGSAATLSATTGVTAIAVRATTVLLDDALGPASVRPSGMPAARDEIAVPRAWAVPADEARAPDTALGLGLFGLRQVPFVARAVERDRLWALLRDAGVERAARAVVVSGEAGAGKTRMVEWIGERGLELSVATVLRATHDSTRSRHAGIGPALARHHRVAGLGAGDAAKRLARDLGAGTPQHEILELVDAMGLQTADAGARIRDPVHKHAVLRRALEALAERRPLLLVCDDAHVSAATLDFIGHLLEARSEAPILAVLTVDAEQLGRRQVEKRMLEQLQAHPACTQLRIERLDEGATRTLVEQVLPLDRDALSTVRGSSGGLPLLVVQTVTDWGERGLLARGPGGFGSTGALPAPRRLDELWERRLDTFVERRRAGPHAMLALGIAALLGDVVDEDEWTSACARAGVDAAPDLWPDLWVARLARRVDRSWSFVSKDLASVVVARMERDGELPRMHAACARMLGERYLVERCGERLARHHLAAGLLEEARGSLLAAAHQALESGELPRAHEHLDRLDETLERIGEPSPSWPRLAALVARCRVLEMERSRAIADTLARATAMRSILPPPADAAQHALASSFAQAVAMRAYQTSDFPTMDRAAREATEHARRAGSASLEGDATIFVGDVHFMQDALEESRHCYEAARAAFEALGDQRRTGMSVIALATVASSQGRHDDARRLGEEAVKHLEAAGAMVELGKAMSELGEHARRRGDLDAAEEYYRYSAAIFGARSIDSLVPSFNLGITLSARGRHAEAREVVVPLIDRMMTRGDLAMAGCAHTVLLACAAAERREDAWETHLRQAESLLAASGLHYDDVAMAAEDAGDLAASWRRDAAERAWRIALEHWTALGRADRADAVARKLRLVV